jgi:glycosyltransferase involved in cell wall biosynthesis
MTRFSIIITSHNQAAFIGAAVDSALSQPYPEKEIVVVDDASNDGSPSLLEAYGNEIIFVKVQTNLGANGARNLGASRSSGDFFVFLDGDDLLQPWALETYHQVVREKNPALILSRLQWFEGYAAPKLAAREIPDRLETVDYDVLIEKDRSFRASASAMVVSRNTFQQVRGWTDGIFPMDDLDLLLKLLYHGPASQILAPPTVFYRVHPDNTVHQVASCIAVLHRIIQKERKGDYSAGQPRRFRRYAFVGGPVIFWIKKAYRHRLYFHCIRLVISGWAMIMAAIGERLLVVAKGRRRTATVALHYGLAKS